MKKLVACLTGMLIAFSSLAFAGDWDITVFRPAVNPRDHKNDVMVRAADKYKAETGGKVTFIMGDWGEVPSKVLSHMAAGDPIDVVFCRDQDFPRFYVKGFLQPVEKYVDIPNLTGFDGKKIPNTVAENKVFKYDGHYYAASHITSNHFWQVIYNKSLMEEEGIKESEQPLALYKAGKWDWEHFAALARKLTKDTGGTGTIDRWGFGNWNTQAFVYMNGSEFTTKDAKGNLKLNFSDPKLLEALSFLEQAKKEGWYQQDSSIAQTGLQNRTVAMYMEREGFQTQVMAQTDDEIGFVPLPHGPSVKAAPAIFETDGYGIGNGSKKQVAAGKFIEYALKEWYISDMATRNKEWTDEMFAFTAEMNKDPYYPGPTASAIDSIMNDFLGEIIWTGNSPAAAIEKWTPKATALVTDANKPMGKLERLPFKGISQTFDKMKEKKLAEYFTPWAETKTAKISLVSGKEAISGKQSLKLEFTPEEGSTGAILTLSNPEEFGIVGWRDYKVTFSAKMVGEKLADDPNVWIKAYADEVNEYGFIKKTFDDNTTVYTVTGSIKNVTQNGKIGIMIGCNGCTGVIIDDFIIEEK